MARINDVFHSDIFIMPDKKVFVPDPRTENGLQLLEPEDFTDFYDLLEKSYRGKSSYTMIYEGFFFRVERTNSMYGPMYCMRKMPKKVPDLMSLGYPPALINYLAGLGNASGLILLGGATGSGKTTTISSLLAKSESETVALLIIEYPSGSVSAIASSVSVERMPWSSPKIPCISSS